VNAVGATTVEAPGEGSLRGALRRRERRAERSVSFPELVWMHYMLLGTTRESVVGRAQSEPDKTETRGETGLTGTSV
jgi:hypothetical protein